tara:strand:- start:30112 stop:30393 length:282 start_codon:yes stop_codon:yes gene_type:complete
MKIKEIMERAGINSTGRAIAFIKDALAEMNSLTEINIRRERFDITKDKRFYDLPNELVKVIDIRCKHHDNTDDTYKSIPRMIPEPIIEDTDGV